LESEPYEVRLSAFVAERDENSVFDSMEAAKLAPVCGRWGFVEQEAEDPENDAHPRVMCPYDHQAASLLTFFAESVTVAQCAEFVSALRAALQLDVRDGKLARAHVDGWGSWKLASLPRYENCLGFDTEGPYRFIHALPDYDYLAPSLPQYTNMNVGMPRHDPPRASLVLDLDETLIHTEVVPIDDADFVFTLAASDGDGLQHMYVRKRPHAERFLREVSKHFEIIIFTASERPYAENVLSQLDPDGSFIDYVLCREDCLFIEGEFVKDLNTLGRDMRRVALVDNRPEMYCFQINNGIPISSWFDDRQDCELLRLLPSLERLASISRTAGDAADPDKFDVRRYIRHHWRTYAAVERVAKESSMLDAPFASDVSSNHDSSSGPPSPASSPPPSPTSSPVSSPNSSPLSVDDEDDDEVEERQDCGGGGGDDDDDDDGHDEDDQDLYSVDERHRYPRCPLQEIRA